MKSRKDFNKKRIFSSSNLATSKRSIANIAAGVTSPYSSVISFTSNS
jgi:hypothetical protein